MSAAFIGLDLAKSVFQIHGVDAQGKVVVTKRLRRDAVLAFFANLAPCVVGMEACAGSHFWAREIARLGHTVRLMAPQYVKPYTQASQERPGRCRGDLRSGPAAEHALRGGQDRGAAEYSGDPPGA